MAQLFVDRLHLPGVLPRRSCVGVTHCARPPLELDDGLSLALSHDNRALAASSTTRRSLQRSVCCELLYIMHVLSTRRSCVQSVISQHEARCHLPLTGASQQLRPIIASCTRAARTPIEIETRPEIRARGTPGPPRRQPRSLLTRITGEALRSPLAAGRGAPGPTCSHAHSEPSDRLLAASV